MVLIERLRAILGSDRLVLEEIKRELAELKRLYGDKRRTEIIPETHDISIEDMIADEPMVITVTQSGYIKRSPLTLYRAQARGGKGRTGMVTKDDDFVEHLYVATAHSYILVFTESGRVHWLKVHEIPETGTAAKGKAIVNLLELEPSERLATTVAVREFRDDRYLVFATAKGTVKKTALSAYANPRLGGIIGINIDEGDRLLSVRETDGRKDILFATAKGFSIRFPESDVRAMGRATYGVKGIELRPGDRVVAMEELDPHGQMLTVTERGYGKRTPVEDYRLQSRGGLGSHQPQGRRPRRARWSGSGTSPRRRPDAHHPGGDDHPDQRLRRARGRPLSAGRRLMNLEAGDRIVAVAKLAEKDEETEIELAKDDGSPVPAELELEAAETEDTDDLEILDTSGFEEDEDDDDGGPDETVH